MSYYTNVEFTFADEPPDFGAVLDRARQYLESRGDGTSTCISCSNNCVVPSKRRRVTSRGSGPTISRG